MMMTDISMSRGGTMVWRRMWREKVKRLGTLSRRFSAVYSATCHLY